MIVFCWYWPLEDRSKSLHFVKVKIDEMYHMYLSNWYGSSKLNVRPTDVQNYWIWTRSENITHILNCITKYRSVGVSCLSAQNVIYLSWNQGEIITFALVSRKKIQANYTWSIWNLKEMVQSCSQLAGMTDYSYGWNESEKVYEDHISLNKILLWRHIVL